MNRTLLQLSKGPINATSKGLSTLAFKAFGGPLSVQEPVDLAPCTGNQVKVEMTSSPVTIQDLLFTNGTSLVSNCGKNLVNSKPGVAGLVGLGTVTEVGSNVQHVKASDKVIVSQTGTWTKKGIFRGARVRKAPSVSPEDTGAFCVGLSAWGILNSGSLKQGDSVVHNLDPAGPLASAVSAVAKELGVTMTDKTDTKNAAMAITSSPGSKLSKCLGPEGTLVACAEKSNSSAMGSSQSISVTDTIFNGMSVVGFDLGTYLATADDATLAKAFRAVEDIVKSKKITIKSKVYPTSDFATAIKSASAGSEMAVLKF